ncbi:hypothetical protein FQN54_007948 [Arachnomyces sp. PD_36]|nr:hypothetical protein FQN54_007948 [Arachnomyces sp. PD_36]
MRSTTSSVPVRILSHNIRYATSSPFQGEEPWPARKQLLLNELEYHARHNQESFLCLQEVLHVQLVDILSGLNSANSVTAGCQKSKEVSKDEEEWAYIGVGRDDGKEAGEYAPIFYRPATWELLDWKTVWLSETPTIPSKSWDAASIRIVTIGVFKHRASRKTVLALNTHLDDQGARSRLEAAKIILEQIKGYTEPDNSFSAVFLAGDFNSKEDDGAYQTLTASDSNLLDSQKLVSSEYHYGNENTFTGFGYESVPPKRIDYVLLGPSGSEYPTWNVQGYSVQASRFDDMVYNSDHRAVIVDTQLL